VLFEDKLGRTGFLFQERFYVNMGKNRRTGKTFKKEQIFFPGSFRDLPP
jgi:hypothetical protein